MKFMGFRSPNDVYNLPKDMVINTIPEVMEMYNKNGWH
jgi:hypothetical protein